MKTFRFSRGARGFTDWKVTMITHGDDLFDTSISAIRKWLRFDC